MNATIHWDEIQHRSLFFNHAEQTRRHAGYILEETPELALVHKTQFLTHFLDTLIGEIKHLFGFGNQRFVNPIGKVATAHLFDYGRKIISASGPVPRHRTPTCARPENASPPVS